MKPMVLILVLLCVAATLRMPPGWKGSKKSVLRSPKDAEVQTVKMRIVIPLPPPRRVYLAWQYPTNEIPKVYFIVESTTNLINWAVMEYVTNNTRSSIFDAVGKCRFFRVGAEWR